ncbi:methyltransferase domain-containing protein [Planctomonas psychrotolerans]|uniref:methyltransferase domain-containing protein n=1 Tax=Planctomonas psychrotolerans TaxID=2528712 RepID=UPI00123A06DE|nr:methyltransferase domain-containing protein [Planctomonas psychrotolerans]
MASEERYTHGHHESVLRSHSWRTIDNSAAYLEPHLAPGLSLLDVGSGPGTITVEFGERLAPGRVVGIDAAETIVRSARSTAADHEVSNVEFEIGDAYALDFPDDSFDIVHAHQTLQHVADPVAVLREMRRVAKPGGLVAARDVDYSGVVLYPESPGLSAWAALYQRVHRSNGGEPDAGPRLKAWARAAGFRDVTASASIWCFSSDAERDWWGNSWAVRVTESAFGVQAVERGFATASDLEDIRNAWLAWAADADGWLGMPHGEILARKDGGAS